MKKNLFGTRPAALAFAIAVAFASPLLAHAQSPGVLNELMVLSSSTNEAGTQLTVRGANFMTVRNLRVYLGGSIVPLDVLSINPTTLVAQLPPGMAPGTYLAQAVSGSGSGGEEFWFTLGEQGPTGAAGPAGPAGPQGPAGPMGATGLTGPAGPAGPIGATGPAGPVGATGSQGATGATGPQGPQGPVGTTGATGATGPQGSVGATGATGPQGPAGPQGPVGPQGPAGTLNVVSINAQVLPLPASPSLWIFVGNIIPSVSVAGTATRLTGAVSALLATTGFINVPVDLHLCTQLGTAALVPFNASLPTAEVGPTRSSYSAMAARSGLSAGTYRVGMCIRTPAALGDNDWVQGWIMVH